MNMLMNQCNHDYSMYTGFGIEIVIVPPDGLAFEGVKLFARSQRTGKRYEFDAQKINGQWMASLSAEQTATMSAGKYSIQLDYAEVGIERRLPTSITTFDLLERV